MDRPQEPDLRTVLLGAGAWAGGLLGSLTPAPVAIGVLVAAAVGVLVRCRRGRPVLVVTGCLASAAVVAGSVMLRSDATTAGVVAELARDRAFVSAVVEVTSDPRLREGRFGPYVLLHVRTDRVTGRGRTYDTGVPVLVIAEPSWLGVELGSVVTVAGRLTPARGDDLAAVLAAARHPVVVERPGVLYRTAAVVRAGIRSAVAGAPPEPRSLVPALVVGDDHGMSAALVQEFQAAGLTHLTAVSGTNLTLVVGFVLVVARWAGVRARGLIAVGCLGVAGFVLLARTEPSVVRAAAMGSVALLGMGTNGRERGARALGVAVLLLLLVDPWLATSIGFSLSVLATAGIIFLAPPWRDAMTRWLPRWLAEAVSVPLAAQLVCTPVVAAISGQVSLVAVVANMLVAPAVGPATVMGLAAGTVLLAVEPAGRLLGYAAGWSAWWITAVAGRSADLPTAALDWPVTVVSVLVLTVTCVVIALVMPAVLSRPAWSAVTAVVAVTLLLRPAGSLGWPPDDWVLVACDVGQGDGLVLNAGGGRAVVVDVGGEPEPIRRCLRRLDVDAVPSLVLTHFHADHIGGLAGVLEAVPVAEVQVTHLAEPAAGARAVRAAARRRSIPVRVSRYGEVMRVGEVTWQVVGPVGGTLAAGGESAADEDSATGEESAPNNASVVLVAVVRGVRILLTGDMEPGAQEQIARTLPALQVDVLKVPHHGSRYQDFGFLSGLGARVAVVSVGEDNDYGHPAPETIAAVRGAGMLVRRTDLSGDVAVVLRDGRMGLVTQRRP